MKKVFTVFEVISVDIPNRENNCTEVLIEQLSSDTQEAAELIIEDWFLNGSYEVMSKVFVILPKYTNQ